RPANREPGADTRAVSMPAARQSRHTKIIYRNRDHLTALFADSGLNLPVRRGPVLSVVVRGLRLNLEGRRPEGGESVTRVGVLVVTSRDTGRVIRGRRRRGGRR